MARRRVIVVTGAASGIGLATVSRLANPECALVITTRGNAEGLRRAEAAAQAQGASTASALFDLSAPGQCAALIAFGRESFGAIDQIVSNAGEAKKALVRETSVDDLAKAIALNTNPFLELTQAPYEDIGASPVGRVVAVSSFVASSFGINDTVFPATAAAKSALVAVARSLAFELARTGATVNCVAPGFTAKDPGRGALSDEAWQAAAKATPNGRLADPGDIAATIGFLLSDEARHITGQVINVDGGLSLR